MAELLRDKLPEHEHTIERIATALITDRDMQDFAKMIQDVYRYSYLKGGIEIKNQVEAAGIKVDFKS